MELWTEYEGRTIDGAFPLKKLLLPEGRSAFFSTANGKGEATVIRLIACHYDEDEILARWRGIEALNHPHLLKLEKYGQLKLDDSTVVYAVIERVDANLAQVIQGQRITVEEARQLAASLTSAIETLHRNGFVHEHVEPASVFAVGEAVKLRSDCIRETPEGEKGLQAKRQDIHDLAVVVLLALTQQRTLQAAASERPLPAPLDQIVEKGISGEWGLAEITAALQAPERPSPPAKVVASSPVYPADAPPATGVASASPHAAPPAASPSSAAPEPSTVRVAPPAASGVRPASLPHATAPASRAVKADPPATRIQFLMEDLIGKTLPGMKWKIAAAFAAILLLWLGWHHLHAHSAKSATTSQTSSTTASAPLPATHSGADASSSPTASAARTKPRPMQDSAAAGGSGQWRVIAYTYNFEEQAKKKAATVELRHPELRPSVFTPTGHAPYLVTLGGFMSREEAFALAGKAHVLGLPHDVYAQNYRYKR